MDSGKTILLVEDEPDLAELIRYNLEQEGYSCRRAADGSTALAEARRSTPDLVILDRMLPRQSGDDVLARLRRDPQMADVPVLILTAKADEADQLVGFALGADDYVTKPFSIKLLLARIGALLRRAAEAGTVPGVLSTGPVRLDTDRFEVTVEGKPVALTATEFRMLKVLMAACGRVFTRDQLIDAVLGANVAVTDRTIDVHIAALRKKLGAGSHWIQTIRGAGYAFRQPIDD